MGFNSKFSGLEVEGLLSKITDATSLSIFNTHNTDNIRHITGAERTKWDKVVTDFAGLEVGGRNLVKDSAKTIVSTTTYYLTKTSQQLKGKTITVSFEYEYENVSTGKDQFSQRFGFEWPLEKPNGYYYYLGNWVMLPASSTGLNGSGRAIKTLTVPSDHTDMVSTAKINIQVAGGTVRVWNFKIEEGNKATSWSPAPEDQVSDWNTTDVNSFSFIKNKPTTLSGYGITDALPLSGGTLRGDIHTSGTLTQDSDIRLKDINKDILLSIEDIANAPLFEFTYKNDEHRRIHVGTSAQYWIERNNWFCKKQDNGYYDMEIQNLALASAISIAKEFKKYKEETESTISNMKKEIEELKQLILNMNK